jgi:flagellar biosynthesis/type III secretory pathway chaperone
MPYSPEQQATFLKILNHEIEQIQQLLGLLKQEYELLKQPPSKALDDLLEIKKRLLIQVDQSTKQHNNLLNRLGLTTDRKGNDEFIQQCPDKSGLKERWSHFSSLLESCQKQNEINGGAVRLNQHQVTQALDILRGLANGDKTYGPGGEARPTSSSKSLGKA